MKTKLYIRLAMVFFAMIMFILNANSQTTISVQVSDSGDDIEEVNEEGDPDPVGTIDMTSSDLEFIQDDGFIQMVGMIFRNVQIPPNANITNAYIQFYSDKALDGGPVTCKFFGGAVANIAAPFTDALNSVSILTQTVATVSWNVPPFGAPGVATEAERSPDISSIIQEIVTISGWASGNNLMIGVKNDSDVKAANREAVSFDGTPTQAPILNVTYNTNPIGIDQEISEFSGLIYPNPTKGKLYIKNPASDIFEYEIFAVDGKLVVAMYQLSGSYAETDLSGLAKGMYFVNVRSGHGTEMHKIILE